MPGYGQMPYGQSPYGQGQTSDISDITFLDVTYKPVAGFGGQNNPVLGKTPINYKPVIGKTGSP